LENKCDYLGCLIVIEHKRRKKVVGARQKHSKENKDKKGRQTIMGGWWQHDDVTEAMVKLISSKLDWWPKDILRYVTLIMVICFLL